MPEYVLRVEGVNLANVIDDTDDLSTRRGGGLLLLYAVRQLTETLPADLRDRLKPIALGASIGLFTLKADPDEAETIAERVREHLRTETVEDTARDGVLTHHLPLEHATFVVDLAPVGDHPAEAVERAIAANRWRQLREPSLSLADLWPNEATTACTLSFTRPATTTIPLPGQLEAPVSRSVADRRAYGKRARQGFYAQTAGTLANLSFTDDLQTLADGRGLDDPVAPSNTRGKLAVFHVDGNGFGRKGRDLLERGGLEAFGEWSRALESHHAALLKDLLDRAQKRPGWTTAENALRLETLLWGGDEILWVVPAWKGWELAEWFFARPHAVTLSGRSKPLSYGAGMVFCHVTAPIQNVVRLAHELADLAKDQGRSANANRLAYEVLESFDDVLGGLEAHRSRSLPPGTDPAVLVFDPSRPPEFWRALRAIARADDSPTRQLYRLAAAWRRGEDETVRAAAARLSGSSAGPALKVYLDAFGDAPAAWSHLLQILPYLPTAPEGPA